VQGNSRGLLDSNQVNTDGYNWDAFGNLISRGGTNPTAFAWGGGSGYQSDGDSGLKLLGHRYYDSRTGRFISQDPAGDGDNWYAYCGNDPMDEADPDGLSEVFVDATMAGAGWTGHGDWSAYHGGEWGTYDWFGTDGHGGMKYNYTEVVGPSVLDTMMAGGLGLNMGAAMFAGPQNRGGGRLTPGEAEDLNNIALEMEKKRRLALRKVSELYEDKQSLRGQHPDERRKPSLSRRGHRIRMEKIKADWGNLKARMLDILEKAGIATEGIADDISLDFGFVYFDPHLADYYMRRRYPGGA